MPRNVEDWISSYMQYVRNSEPPSMFHLWCAISVLGSALQRKCVLEWGPISFFPNMYIVLVAPSGKARKGTAMGFALDFLEQLGVNLAAEAVTREALIRELKNSAISDVDVDNARMGARHSSLTIFSPELTVFLGYHNHQLMSDLTDWYDCRSKWIYRTKTQGTDTIHGVFVNLIGATTPELIRTTMPLDAIGGGLTSRIIFVFEPDKEKIVPTPFLSKEDLKLAKELSDDLQRIHRLSGKFQVSEDFLDEWIRWYPKQSENPPFSDPRFSGYIERRPNHVMKLSIILNASRTDNMIITRDDLLKSVQILRDTERNMVQTFAGVGKNVMADTLVHVMQEIGMRGEITFSQLQALFQYDANSRDMSTMVETLEASGFCKVVSKGGEQIIRHVPEEENGP